MVNNYSNREGYDSPEYKAWRNAVFVRDKWTCQLTGEKGCELEAHHIVPWAKAPHLRYVVSNGITLSKKSHDMVTRAGEDKFEKDFQKIVQFKKKEYERLTGKKSRTATKDYARPKWRPRNPKLRF